MKKMKKSVCLVLVVVAVLATAIPAFAGTIVTPGGGRAFLWRYATSSGEDYVAYISSGNSAYLLNSNPSNNRYNVNAYGYNSVPSYAWYKGWINTAYYQP